jgi:hypothetical protein
MEFPARRPANQVHLIIRQSAGPEQTGQKLAFRFWQ